MPSNNTEIYEHLYEQKFLKHWMDLIASSSSTGPEALSSLVLLDIYWTHKWYISVLPKIYQITFSAWPPFWPVPFNHPLTGFKMGRTNATHLWRMSCPPPHNVLHWGHPFKTVRYTEVTLWWRVCVNPGHHAMLLVQMGAMYREVFWAITEMQNKK